MTRALSVSRIPAAIDDEPLDSLDRNAAVGLASSAVAWCEGLLAETQTEEEDEAGEDSRER